MNTSQNPDDYDGKADFEYEMDMYEKMDNKNQNGRKNGKRN